MNIINYPSRRFIKVGKSAVNGGADIEIIINDNMKASSIYKLMSVFKAKEYSELSAWAWFFNFFRYAGYMTVHFYASSAGYDYELKYGDDKLVVTYKR
jgi:hypothetical protein